MMPTKTSSRSFSSKSDMMDFLKTEYEYVSNHGGLIYETRDRFFGNFMTASLAIFSFIGFLGQYQNSALNQALNLNSMVILVLMLLITLGIGTLLIITSNWIARDYYRQRRRKLQDLLSGSTDDSELTKKIEAYMHFSRNKTRWKYKTTSLYFVYNSCIAVVNSVAVALALRVYFIGLRNVFSVAIVIIGFILHHLLCTGFSRLYVRSEYPEG